MQFEAEPLSNWFKREKEGILTDVAERIHAPDGLWVKCPDCKKPTHFKELRENLQVCPSCGYHHREGSQFYFEIIFDDAAFTELFTDLQAKDPLQFKDTKTYSSRLKKTQADTNLRDAARSAYGLVKGIGLVVTCMDFDFIGGSMGSVVGEKISRSVDYCLQNRLPLLVISKSGGARMMEGTLSLMQMAKTSAKLALLGQAGLPFISLMTNPTTGGVTASYAMLGDLNLAEPKALIGFAGPRVIRETIGKDLPEGFQSSEFLLEKGFLDLVVSRNELRDRIAQVTGMLMSKKDN
jgi:acetyl-CoA carboxylase carboxyl transferase subunit beta